MTEHVFCVLAFGVWTFGLVHIFHLAWVARVYRAKPRAIAHFILFTLVWPLSFLPGARVVFDVPRKEKP